MTEWAERIPAAIAKAEGALHASAHRDHVVWNLVHITATEVALAKALWWVQKSYDIFIGDERLPHPALRAFAEKVEVLDAPT